MEAAIKILVELYLKSKKEAVKIEEGFDTELSSRCKYYKTWKDPFDGEMIPKCSYRYKRKARPIEMMNCRIQDCPLGERK